MMPVEFVSDDKRPVAICFMNKVQIKNRIRKFGFIEVADILRFLELMCDKELDVADYAYIRSKIGSCLKYHDDHSDYFIPLREFATELDCMI